VARNICQASPSKSASESSMVAALGETLRSGPCTDYRFGLTPATCPSSECDRSFTTWSIDICTSRLHCPVAAAGMAVTCFRNEMTQLSAATAVECTRAKAK